MPGTSETSRLVSPPPAVVIILLVWILVAVLLAFWFFVSGIPSLIVAALLGSVAVPLAIILFLRGRSVASRHLHLTMESRSVRPGETVRGHVELRPRRPLTLRSLEASARGGEKVEIVVSTGQGATKIREESLVLDEVLPLRAEGGGPVTVAEPSGTLLQPGRYRYSLSVTIPEAALPSFRGSVASIRYIVRVRARLPRRIDAVTEIEIPVVPSTMSAGYEEHARTPTATQLGPSRPQLVVDVKNRDVRVGGRLEGHVTVSNLRDRRIEGVRLRLREREWGTAQGRETSKSKTLLQTEVAASGGVGGLVAPFSLVVPAGAKPSFVGRISSLRHYLRVRVRLAWARDLRVAEEVRVFTASS